MTLRCARCHRPMFTAYLCIGDLQLGRVCAIRMGLDANKAHHQTLTTHRPGQARATEPDALQFALELEWMP